MLNSAEFHFIQSHKNTVMFFSPGVNIIQGTSHSGKSAMMRGFGLTILNKPRGDGLKSHFADKKENLKVALSFLEGSYVIRQRIGNINQYKIPTDPKPLEAIGATVPEEVEDILQMNEVNFQSQLDPYFLLRESSGKVAKKLNEAVGLQIIDESITKANGLMSQYNIELNRQKKNLKEHQEEIAMYGYIDEAEILILKIDQLHAKYKKLEERRIKLGSLYKHILEMKLVVKDLSEWLQIEVPFLQLEKLHKNYNKLKERSNSIKMKQWRINQSREKVNELTEWLEVEKTYIEMERLIDKYAVIKTRYIDLKRVDNDIKRNMEVRDLAVKALSRDSIKQKELLATLDICPFCNRAMK